MSNKTILSRAEPMRKHRTGPFYAVRHASIKRKKNNTGRFCKGINRPVGNNNITELTRMSTDTIYGGKITEIQWFCPTNTIGDY